MKLSILAKISAMLAGMMAIFVAILVLAYVYLNSLHHIADAGAKRFLEFGATARLSVHGILLSDPLHDYLITGNKREATREFAEHVKSTGRQLRALRRRPAPPGEQRLIGAIETEVRGVTRLARRLWRIDDPIDDPAALAIERQADRRIERLEDLLDELEMRGERTVRKSLLHADAIHGAQRNLIMSFVLVLGAAVGFSLAIRRYITQPIVDLHRGVDYVRAGNLAYRLNIRTGDEIEDLAAAFNGLVDAVYDEQRQAAEIQRHLLPREPIDMPGVRLHARLLQSGEVGGDWYDFYVAGRQLRFAVGDASGIGMPAAVVATLAIAVMRLASGPPMDVVEQANRVIADRLGDGGSFATVLYGELSPAGTINCVSCGHEFPLVYRAADGKWVGEEWETSLPLGVSANFFEPHAATIKLARGDKLIVFTDGLRDARDADHNFFEMHSILDSLEKNSAKDIEGVVEGLLDDVTRFAGGRFPDDVAVLGLEIT